MGLLRNTTLESKPFEKSQPELGKPVAILQDLPGPKIRLGVFHGGRIELSNGDLFTLTTEWIEGDQTRASVNYPKLATEVRRGQTILLAMAM